MSVAEVLIVASIGLVAGMAGGLLGIGGSIIMIPGLTLLLGPNQHLYQASAMAVNAVVAAAALRRHLGGGSVRREVVMRILPAGIVAMLIGVAVSDQLDATTLKRLFGLFLLWFGMTEIASMALGTERTGDRPERTGWMMCTAIGVVMGFLAGLLGIGGGVIIVPLLRRVAGLPLRHAIGTTTAAMLVTSSIGAVHKNWTLATHPAPDGTALTIQASFQVFALIAPAAIVGAFVGSHLNYRMPLGALRLLLVALILFAAVRMLEIPELLGWAAYPS